VHAPARTAVALVVLTACSPAGSTTASGDPPAPRHVAIDQLPDLPGEADPEAVVPREDVDPRDATAVAIGRILVSLSAQGLDVVDIDADTRSSTPERTTVRVVATHRLAGGPDHTSVYDLDLARRGGRWRVVAARTVQ
jgi:hypothetical protein